jgi:hypothetical protein
MSPAAKAKSARSPRTGGSRAKAKAKAKDPEPETEEDVTTEEEEDESGDNGEAPEESARDAARRAKEEKAAAEREEAIESGDLIVTDNYEFTASTKRTTSAETMMNVIDAYRESDEPLVFAEVASKAGAKYPEDLVISMYVLEELDFVRKFTARPTGEASGRSKVAFLWLGEEVE